MKSSALAAARVIFHGTLALSAPFFMIASRAAWGQTATITKATIFKQIDKGNTLGFLVQIEGTNLTSPHAGGAIEQPRVILLPSTGVTNPSVPTITPTLITMNFTAPSTYVPLEVSLSYALGAPLAQAVTGTDCAPDVDVVESYFLVPQTQVAKKYGHGVAHNFDVVQVSIVNKCPLPILVPLAGISLPIDATLTLHPFSLDHVTSIFSNDQKFSGPRAIFFNILQGTATVGSAIEPFLASGFTKGVSIFGGAFTQGAGSIWKDMTSEQLQNLTSQSFQATEQIAGSGGTLQKSIFVPITNNPKKPNKKIALTALLSAANTTVDHAIQLQIIPVLTAGK